MREVSWFARLFYIVRLFIYHTEAQDKPALEKNILQAQFTLMESRLWNIITTPAMILTLLSGIGMLYLNPAYLKMPWMHVKLGFVLGLLIYHRLCLRILRQLKKGAVSYSSTQLRIWNEVATLFLVSIVFIVVLKSTLDWIWGLLGLVSVGVLLMLGIRIYKRFR